MHWLLHVSHHNNVAPNATVNYLPFLQSTISPFLTCSFIVFLGAVFVGPSDVGGSCPTGTYQYTSQGVDHCCCEGGCCWENCRMSNPPDDCLPPGATWMFTVDEDSPDNWEHDGKVGYFQARAGEKTRCMK